MRHPPAAATPPIADVPPGFSPVDTLSGFLTAMGPIYEKVDAGRRTYGLRVEERHCNTFDKAHGGTLAGLADVTLARSLAHMRTPFFAPVTLSLNVEFVAAAPRGGWLEGYARIRKADGSIAFAEAEFHCDGKLVAIASGVFKYPRHKATVA
ncbi:MAG: PaaI family thioesterase [Proteobacteria bacterium]|nr:PaaI family thioesterase [Pseudomonadota bacterium]HQR03340.1 PaaI family thioesterase [Rhodocyclaceae bacterium]